MLPRKTHLEMADALRLVKSTLSDYEGTGNTYVCLTIDYLVRFRQIDKKIGDHLLNWIYTQLDGKTAKSWAVWECVYLNDYQVYRKAWIDHMIKILES
jgi:hypothetical protein